MGFSEVQLIPSAARCSDLHWIPWLCIISTARLQQCHWANRCLCTQHLMRICGYQAHHSLQYRPENALPCPMQQFTLTFFGYFQTTAHPICSQVHWLALSPMFLYHFHSATGLALSLHTASDVDLCKGCNTDQCTPSQAGCSNSRSIRFYFLPKCSSPHLQPGALTCIESHDCVSFPQLDCNSANRLTAVSARNIWCGFVNVRLITRCNTDLSTPSPAPCSNLQRLFVGFSEVQLIPSAARCTDWYWVPWLCIISTAWLQQCQQASRCLCTQHLMWIRGSQAHHLLQYRPVNTLPCPMQQLTIYISFGFFRSTAHPICSQVHWFAFSPMFLYHFHSLTATMPLG